MAAIGAGDGSQAGYTLKSGEPVIIRDLRVETRFQSEVLLVENEVISGVNVAIGTPERTYGVLGAYSAREREFNGDNVQFLMAVANALSVAVERGRAVAEMEKLAEFARLNPNPVMELAADGAVTLLSTRPRSGWRLVRREHPREVLRRELKAWSRRVWRRGRAG